MTKIFIAGLRHGNGILEKPDRKGTLVGLFNISKPKISDARELLLKVSDKKGIVEAEIDDHIVDAIIEEGFRKRERDPIRHREGLVDLIILGPAVYGEAGSRGGEGEGREIRVSRSNCKFLERLSLQDPYAERE